MKYVIDYFGFVYLWRDRKRKMSYIGSHFGSMDDSYKGSSTRFLRAIRKRPHDFRRKILSIIKSSDRKLLLTEEERWLQMIKPEHLNKRYYNIKRCGTEGYVTEGYTEKQKKAYSQKLSESRMGSRHHAARKVFCIDQVYDTLISAKKALGWNPIRRIQSRKYEDFYFVDDKPTSEEIDTNVRTSKEKRRAHIEKLAKLNEARSKEFHADRVRKSLETRKSHGGLQWKKPIEQRSGTRISIDGIEYNNIRFASKITGIKYGTIQKRLRNPNFENYTYVKIDITCSA